MIHQVDDPWGESVADQVLDDTSIGEKKTCLLYTSDAADE